MGGLAAARLGSGKKKKQGLRVGKLYSLAGFRGPLKLAGAPTISGLLRQHVGGQIPL